MLAACLLVLLPLFIISGAIRAVVTGNTPVYFWLGAGLLILTYILSRTKYYQLGIIIVLAFFTLLPGATIIALQYDLAEILRVIIWLAPTLILGSLLLAWRHTAVLITLNVLIISILPLLAPHIRFIDMIYPLGFVAVVVTLLGVSAALRQQYLDQIKVQAAELARSESQFRSLVENSRNGIAQIDSDYRLVYVNDELCRILGHPCEELIGVDFRSLLDKGSRQLVNDNYVLQQRGEDLSTRYEFNVIWKNGQKRRVEISAATFTDENGRLQTIAQLMDITERTRMENALRESEALYQSLVDNLPQNIFRRDLDGRFTFVNKHFCQLYGKPLAEIIGKTDFDLHPPELAQKYRADDVSVINSGQTLETVASWQLIDGPQSFMQTVKTPVFNASGRLIGIQGIFWDITAAKQAQETLQQAHDVLERHVQERTQELAVANIRLKELDHLKNQFIEDMSHELRTPLTTLNLHLDLLEKSGPEKQSAYLAILRQATQRLIHLSEDIMTATRLNLFKKDVLFVPTDINEIAGQTVQGRQYVAQEAGLTMTFSPGTAVPLILADPQQLRQVIHNLLRNSLNYTSRQAGFKSARFSMKAADRFVYK